jgi:transposase-like protein
LENLAGLEYGVGDQIRIGELQFSLAHSARTVAIPEVRSLAAGAEAGQGRYFCAHCRVFIPNAEVKRVGVVGRAKRYLCPKCSGLLDVEPEPTRPLSGSKKWLRHKRRNQPA